MALSNAEKARRFRERQRKKKKETEAARVTNLMGKPFFEWADEANALGVNSNFAVGLDQCGLPQITFSDDSGPKSYTGDIEALHDYEGSESPFITDSNSLARAEVIIGSLIDAAHALAEAVRDYKLSEISARRDELNSINYDDETQREAAFKKIFDLGQMEHDLQKTIRFTFPQWKVTGE